MLIEELRIVAPFHNPVSGYAKAGRGLLAAALLAGIRVEAVEAERNRVTACTLEGPKVWFQPQYDGRGIPEVQAQELRQALSTKVSAGAPTILMGNPGSMADWGEYCDGPRIGYTMLEADTLTPLWAQAARNVDLLLAPSRWCLETLAKDVKGTPTGLLPICVDERLWSNEGPCCIPELRPDQTVPSFLFLSIFSTCERKGWRKTIQAFAEEFRGEDVGLVLKPTRWAEVEELAEWARFMGVWIHVIREELTDAGMAELYRACDVYVSPSAEGFGVPFVEANLCGIPGIGLDAGGTADILNDENGYAVPSIWRQCIGQLPQIYSSRMSWPTCHITELREAMRTAFEAEPKKQRETEDDALCRFSRQGIGKRLKALEIPAKRSAPALPKKARPLVAVITTHNHLESTQRLYISLKKMTPGAQIVLADDNSDMDTVDWAEAAGCLFLPCNSGGNVSANRQKAVDYIKRCSGSFPKDPFLCFFDNDIEVTPCWWETLCDVMEASNLGILAPRKVYGHDGEVQNIGNGLHFSARPFALKMERSIAWPAYVESACMVVRPEVWRQIAWDPAIPYMYEDVDYCYQARALGFEVAATNLSTVVHHAHTTSREKNPAVEKNRNTFLRKWKEQL